MKTTQTIVPLIAGLFITAAVFTACQKNSGTPSNTDTVSVQDQVTLNASAQADDGADNVYNDVFTNVAGVNDDAGLGNGVGVFFAPSRSSSAPTSFGGGGADSAARCFTVTETETNGGFPKTIIIDFGTGCTGKDGHTRRGKITTVYTGKLRESGSTATVSFDGYYIDSIKVEGTLKAENKSTTGSYIFSITVTNGKLSLPSGDFIEVNKTHTWTQTDGSSTPRIPGDDVYNVTGSSAGTAQIQGNTYQWTTEITTPVVRKMSCRWRVAGQVTITRNNIKALLDYGNGECDNKATVTVGQKVFEIILH